MYIEIMLFSLMFDIFFQWLTLSKTENFARFDYDAAMEMENKFKQKKNQNSEIQARDAQFGLTLVVLERLD